MEGLIFSKDLCRLCLWRSSKLFPIFSLEGELQGIPLKIEMFLPISVTREDVLPKLICSQCIYKLEMFSEFRNSCVRSEQLLKRYTSHEPVQIPASHTVVLQMQEEVKVEVQDSDPIAVEQEIPFFCVIPTDMHKEGTEECGPPKVRDENMNRINREAARIENSNVDATAIKKTVKRNRRVVRRKPAPKKPRCFRLTLEA